MESKVPVAVHTGLLDLMHLYYAFYADLPETLGTFVADLSEMFTGGVVDTKYISTAVTKETATFLQYLFRK